MSLSIRNLIVYLSYLNWLMSLIRYIYFSGMVLWNTMMALHHRLSGILRYIDVFIKLFIKIVFLFIILVALLLFNSLAWTFFNHIQITLLVIVIRYWTFKTMSFKSEDLSSDLKTDPSCSGSDNKITFYKHQSSKFGLIVFYEKLAIFKVIYKIGMMSWNWYILRKFDIYIFFASNR